MFLAITFPLYLTSFCYHLCSDRFLPDKAIDLIDEAGSRVRLRHAQVQIHSSDPKQYSSLHDPCLNIP